jgi:hypothetical protein
VKRSNLSSFVESTKNTSSCSGLFPGIHTFPCRSNGWSLPHEDRLFEVQKAVNLTALLQSDGRFISLADEIAELESLDAGKPISAVLRQDLPVAIDTLTYYAGWADKISGEVVPTRDDALTYTIRERAKGRLDEPQRLRTSAVITGPQGPVRKSNAGRRVRVFFLRDLKRKSRQAEYHRLTASRLGGTARTGTCPVRRN